MVPLSTYKLFWAFLSMLMWGGALTVAARKYERLDLSRYLVRVTLTVPRGRRAAMIA